MEKSKNEINLTTTALFAVLNFVFTPFGFGLPWVYIYIALAVDIMFNIHLHFLKKKHIKNVDEVDVNRENQTNENILIGRKNTNG